MAKRHPATIGSTVNPPSGSTLIKTSSGTFALMMWGFDFHHRLHRMEDATADGDAYPVIEGNGLQIGDYTLYGWMVAGAALGLANLTSASNPGPLKVKMDSTTDAGSFHNVNALVHDVRGRWRHVGVGIPVIIQATITAQNPATIEASS